MKRPLFPTTAWTPERAAVWALVLIGLVVFLNSLAGTFVFDDTAFLNNDYLDIASINWLISPAESPMKGRPLAGLTFVANYALGGDRPVGYHLVNMLLHVACAVALFGVVRQTLLSLNGNPQDCAAGRPAQESAARTGAGDSPTGLAFAAALLWMVHPLQTECVNYISQRTESMAGLFVLLSLYCAIRARHQGDRTRWTLLAGLSSWLGVMSKEVAAVGPLLIVLHDLTFGGSSLRATVRRRWPLYAAVFSSWIPSAALMYFLPRTTTVGSSAAASVFQYALNQSVLIVQYFRLALWPDTLLIDYGKPWDVSLLEAVPCAAVVLSLLALTLAVYRRQPGLGYLGAWVFLLLAPTSSFIPIHTEVGAERRMYLPLAAIVVLAVLGIRALVVQGCIRFERWRQPGKRNVFGWAALIQGLLLGCAATALSARTIDRNADYANPLKLWTQAVEELPRNRRAWFNLAAQFRQVAPKTTALVLEEIIRRWPAEAPIYYEVGMYHRYEGNFRRATHYFRQVAKLDPSCLEAQRRLVWILAACDDDAVRDGAEALRIARQLCAQQPDSVEMRDALALAQAECGDFSSARRTVRDAIEKAREEGLETSALEDRLEMFRQERPFRFGVRQEA